MVLVAYPADALLAFVGLIYELQPPELARPTVPGRVFPGGSIAERV